MTECIIKRDGRTVSFDIGKIAGAIDKAFQATGGSHGYENALELAGRVGDVLERENLTRPTVEEIQDIVEQVLIENGFVRTARAYIVYRAERTRARELNTQLMRIYDDITFKDSSDSDIKRENANVNSDTAMGAMLKYGSEGAKQFNTMTLLKPAHADAHTAGDIHIHDLDFLALTTTCCQIDIGKLFEGGFSTGHGNLREPNDISSYTALACIAIQSNQNDQHGGQSISGFDYGMAPGVAKTYNRRFRENLARCLELLCGVEDSEKASGIALEMLGGISEQPALARTESFDNALLAALRERGLEPAERVLSFVRGHAESETDKATFQAMEAFVHNLNTMHSRAGAQTPFSSINYGMDISAEGRMVMRNLLLATERGLGNGETPIFPIQIFRVKEGINYNPEDVNYDLFRLACRVSSKRLFPNFSFQDATFNLQYYKEGQPETEIAYMGCRTRVMANGHDPEKAVSPGRGNLSFTTINLPRLALRAAGNVQLFFDLLDTQMNLVVEQLKERFEIQARKKVKNYPFLMGQGVWIDSDKLDWEDEVREVLKHGTLSMGFIGLAETLKALVGQHHGESESAQNLGIEIVSHMRARMDSESRRTGMNFTLLATPAEGLSGRFVGIDRERFGSIEGVTDREYYTNSFHVPVYYTLPAIRKIQLEGPYHAMTNAGHITYVEMDGSPSDNLEAFETVVRAMHDANIGYGSINHPVDRDPVCGYNGIIGETCPKCGREEGDIPFERIRRITGYLVGTLERFNNAKRAEERDRTKHNI